MLAIIPLLIMLVLPVLAPCVASAALQADLDCCSAIIDPEARLACYDQLSRPAMPSTAVQPMPSEQETAATAPLPAQDETLAAVEGPEEDAESPMSRHWELRKDEGLFKLRAHKPMYMLPARLTSNPNKRPFHDAKGTREADYEELDAVEAKFQISTKLKAWEGFFDERIDLWLGYTQQSHWQMYNEALSRPFRESDYEPELMLVVRTDYDILGLHGRFVNFGLVHQSNGRGDPLSRSWNRVYAQFGFERDNFGLYIRPWYRLRAMEQKDDNRDILDYYGYGDLVLQFKLGSHTLAAIARGNPGTGKGALQLDWTFPIFRGMHGYLQGFTGYGESLIDYNHDQTTIGLGISLSDWY